MALPRYELRLPVEMKVAMEAIATRLGFTVADLLRMGAVWVIANQEVLVTGRLPPPQSADRHEMKEKSSIGECSICGQSFLRRRHNARLCSPECKTEANRIKSRDRERAWREKHRDEIRAKRDRDAALVEAAKSILPEEVINAALRISK